MQKILILIFLYTGALYTSSDYVARPAPFWLTRIVNQAQKEVGLSQDQYASVYTFNNPHVCGIATTFTDSNGRQNSYIHMNPHTLGSYENIRFVALHEAAHITQHQKHKQLPKPQSFMKKDEVIAALGGIGYGLFLYGIAGASTVEDYLMIGGFSELCSGMIYFLIKAKKYVDYKDQLKTEETRADTVATIALQCKTCLEGHIKDGHIEYSPAARLHQGYLSAAQMREISTQHHSDTPCYYHSSPLPRIFHTIQSTPTENLPFYPIWQKIKTQKKSH